MKNGTDGQPEPFQDHHEEGQEPMRFVTVALRPETRSRLFGAATKMQLRKGKRVTMDEAVNTLLDLAETRNAGFGE